MKKRHLFTAVGLLGALSLTGVAFATTDQPNNLTITAAGFVQVNTPAKASDATGGVNGGSAPTWSPVPNSAGSITKGDLYTISPSGTASGNFVATLYLNNPGALSKDYNYINFKVTVYKYGTNPADSKVEWYAAQDVDGNTASAYLTLANGYVTFDLAPPTTGEAYGVSLDDGSFYCISSTASGGSLAPDFYITVKPA